jgi:hypothetical protein
MMRVVSLAAVWLAYVLGVTVAAWLNRQQINPDAVAYLRIAHYYWHGPSHLMLSGAWSPLLSWLMVPWLVVFEDPLLAARAAMAVSAGVFLWGGWCVLRAAYLPAAAILLGTWITMLLGVAWSVVLITPDLLMAGLLCDGISRLWANSWVTDRGTALRAGLVLGLAYLAKAVVLPMSVLLLLGWAGTHLVSSRRSLRQVIRAAAMTGIGLLIIAGPWIGLLSYKYGHLVMATSGAITHTIVGPPDTDRHHPAFRIFHTPEPGRITSLEDPTSLPYKYWSPLENSTYMVHQVWLIYTNAHLILRHLKTFDGLGLGFVSAVLGYLYGLLRGPLLQKERWRWSCIPVIALAVMYLPMYAEDPRYYWAAVPFLLAASFGCTLHCAQIIPKAHAGKRALVLAVVACSFIIGNERVVRETFAPSPDRDALAAQVLAEKLRRTDLVGPIASIGPGHRTGLYVAYLLQVPWLGQREEMPAPEEILTLGAALIIVPRSTSVAEQLREDPRFTNADKALFGCEELRGVLPFEVYLPRASSMQDPCPAWGAEQKGT